MKFGVMFANVGPYVEPDMAAAFGRIAEEHGIESLWAVEHVVVPADYQSQYPYSPSGRMPGAEESPIPDPLIWLTWVGAATTTLRLATGILILPQRNPVILAKELATLDVLSKGRVELGVGVGWLREEFDALGIPFEGKGARTEEYLAAMLALWTMDKPAFAGCLVSFAGIQAMPRPVQRPHPEIVFGGHTPAAFRRAARLAKGWYGFALDLDRTRACIEGLKTACATLGRSFDDVEVSVTPVPERGRAVLDLDGAQRFAELGVRRLILYQPRALDEAAMLRLVEQVERELIGKVSA